MKVCTYLLFFIISCAGAMDRRMINGYHRGWPERVRQLGEVVGVQGAIPAHVVPDINGHSVYELLMYEIATPEVLSREVATYFLEALFEQGYADDGRGLFAAASQSVSVRSGHEYQERYDDTPLRTYVRALYRANTSACNFSRVDQTGANVLHYLALMGTFLTPHAYFVRDCFARGASVEESIQPESRSKLDLMLAHRHLVPDEDSTPLAVYLASCRMQEAEPDSDICLVLMGYLVPIRAPDFEGDLTESDPEE